MVEQTGRSIDEESSQPDRRVAVDGIVRSGVRQPEEGLGKRAISMEPECQSRTSTVGDGRGQQPIHAGGSDLANAKFMTQHDVERMMELAE